MAEHPNIRKRIRFNPGPVETMQVDPDIARRSQELIQQKLEESDQAEADKPRDRYLRGKKKQKSKTKRGRGDEKRRDYVVGRGKPPVEHRFPKGTSGNKNGRPRKPKPTIESRLEAMLAEQQTVTVNGKQKRMSMEDIGIRQIVTAHAKGDLRATVHIEKMRERNRARAASGEGTDHNLLQAPSPEVMCILAALKKEELIAHPALSGLTDEQIEVILSVFQLGAEIQEILEGGTRQQHDASDGDADEEGDEADEERPDQKLKSTGRTR